MLMQRQWVNLPKVSFRGPHGVLVPDNFQKRREDFDSNDAFLEAVRAEYAKRHKCNN